MTSHVPRLLSSARAVEDRSPGDTVQQTDLMWCLALTSTDSALPLRFDSARVLDAKQDYGKFAGIRNTGIAIQELETHHAGSALCWLR